MERGKEMRQRLIAVLTLALILINMLNMAFIIKPTFAINLERTQTKPDYKIDFGNTGLDTRAHLERELDRKQGKTLETYSQTSQLKQDTWDFNDTGEWGNLAYSDGDKTRLIVGLDTDKHASLLLLEEIAAEHEAKIVNTVSIKGEVQAAVVELLWSSVTTFVQDTRVTGLASYIEPSIKLQTQFIPNDPFWSTQWGPQRIEADWAWNTTMGNSSVLVSVVDTGIDYTHEDLAANYIDLGYDWVNMDDDPMDDNGHGTHVAGIIAAVLNNSIGIAGLAQVRVMAEKVLTSWGVGYPDWIANGIINATDAGADIISMSLGGYFDSELIHEAVQYAYDAGVLVIAAAGNEDTNAKLYPAGYDEVVAVAATDQLDNKAWFSNWGEWIELAAPGVEIYSTVPWGYEAASGTSMACPHVAGVAALIWSQYPNRTRDWVRLWLRYTADDLGEEGFDQYFGYGRTNARKAVEQSMPLHEVIMYEWRTPPFVKPGASGIINATVLNFGESNETDVLVQLLANDTVVDFTEIGSLASGNSITVNLQWNPTIEGRYNITVYVAPVPGETSLENNVVWKHIFVGFPVKAVVLNSAGNVLGNIITNWQVLNSEWHRFGDTMVYIDYTTLNKEDITYEDIVTTDADVLVISCAFDRYSGWEFTDSEIDAIERYVQEGHGLIATAGTLYYGVPNNNKLGRLFGLDETVHWDVTGTDLLHLLNDSHPLFHNAPNPLVFPYVGSAVPSDWRWDSNELRGGEYVALGHYYESAVVTYKGLVYISPWLEVIPAYYHHHLQLLYNAITWSRYQKPEHELIVSLETPQYLQPSESVQLNASVSNLGTSNETDVDFTLLIDGTIVNSTTIPQLVSGAHYELNYLWTPSAENVYNITAYAPPTPGEELTFNNIESKLIYVRVTKFVLWDDTHDLDGDSLTGNYFDLYDLLTATGFVVDELTSGLIQYELLTDYDILVIVDPEIDFSSSEIADIQEWILAGGAMFAIVDTGYPVSLNTLLTPYGVQMTEIGSGSGTTNNITSHPITQNVNSIFYNLAWKIEVTPPSMTLAWTTESYEFLSTTEGGEVVVISDSNVMDNSYLHQADNTQLLLNIFNWIGVKYEHDLAVNLEIPPYLEPNDSATLNATICNRGQHNETGIALQMLINGTLAANGTVEELFVGECYTINYLWTPLAEAVYNITAYSQPLPDDENPLNNIVTKTIKVRPIKGFILFDQTHETDSISDYSTWVQNLTELGYIVEIHTSGLITRNVTEGYDVLVIPQAHDYYSPDELTAIQDFVLNGGGLVVIGDDRPDVYTDLTSFAGITWVSGGDGGYATDITPHPVTEGVSSAYFDSPVSMMYVNLSSIDLIRDYYGNIMLAVSEPGAGKVIGVADEHSINDYYIDYVDNLQLAVNMIVWPTTPRPEHDLAVYLLAPSYIELGNSTLIEETVRNKGLNNETDVELNLLINGTLVRNVTVDELLVDESYTVSYSWTPTRTGNYNITAYALPVPGEEEVTNNMRVQRVAVFFYRRLYLPNEWVGGGNPMGWHADDMSWLYILPFDFPFYGRYYREIYISSNGLITFLGPDSSFNNEIFRLAEKLAIAPAWDDWTTYSPHDIYLWENSSHVGIRWNVAALYNTSTVANFEAVLNSNGVIQLNYEHNNGSISATIGISNGAGHILAENFSNINYTDTIVFTPFQAEHELAVSLNAPELVLPGTSAGLNATVLNLGLSNETGVELSLVIEGVVVNSSLIPQLPSGASGFISYLWTPISEGTHNVTAYSPPVIDEETVENNVATKMVWVGLPEIPELPSDKPCVYVTPAVSVRTIGETVTISVNIFNLTDTYIPDPEDPRRGIPLGNLYGFDVQFTWDPTILEYLDHTVTVPVEDYPEGTLHEPILEIKNVVSESGGIPDADPQTRAWFVYASLSPAAPFNGNGTVFYMTFRVVGEGTSDLSFVSTLLATNVGESILHENLNGVIIGGGPVENHDVAITNVTCNSNLVSAGKTVNITVLAINNGSAAETFNVTVYANTTVIGTQTINNLASGENTTLTFSWNTTGLTPSSNYTIWAEANSVPGETALENNVFVNGHVKIRIRGDINGDDKVDLTDLVLAAAAYGSRPGDPHWNPEADLAPLYGIIDIFDLVTLAALYGTGT